MSRNTEPVTLGELLTSGTLTKTNAFTGPVLAISGDADLPYCGSDCLATGGVAASIPAQLIQNFPSVDPENFTAYIQPNTGHAINLHYNSTGAYAVIHNFFTAKMLQSS